MSYQEFRPRSFNILPPVIKNLLIINILMFIAKVVFIRSLDIDLDKILGLHYFSAPDFRPWQLVTYLFMHGDLRHLFFNMFAVWMFGSTLENVWGAKRFIFYYLITGFGAAIIQYIVIYVEIRSIMETVSYLQNNLSVKTFESFVNSEVFTNNLDYTFSRKFNEFVPVYNEAAATNPNKAISLASAFLQEFKNYQLNARVIIGASGSLFGILLAFGMLFPNTMLYLYFLVPVKAKWFVIGYGAIELFLGLKNSPLDNVAHFAHLGGMLFGFFVILIWKKNRNFYS